MIGRVMKMIEPRMPSSKTYNIDEALADLTGELDALGRATAARLSMHEHPHWYMHRQNKDRSQSRQPRDVKLEICNNLIIKLIIFNF
jgi:hypothetical protein